MYARPCFDLFSLYVSFFSWFEKFEVKLIVVRERFSQELQAEDERALMFVVRANHNYKLSSKYKNLYFSSKKQVNLYWMSKQGGLTFLIIPVLKTKK